MSQHNERLLTPAELQDHIVKRRLRGIADSDLAPVEGREEPEGWTELPTGQTLLTWARDLEAQLVDLVTALPENTKPGRMELFLDALSRNVIERDCIMDRYADWPELHSRFRELQEDLARVAALWKTGVEADRENAAFLLFRVGCWLERCKWTVYAPRINQAVRKDAIQTATRMNEQQEELADFYSDWLNRIAEDPNRSPNKGPANPLSLATDAYLKMRKHQAPTPTNRKRAQRNLADYMKWFNRQDPRRKADTT